MPELVFNRVNERKKMAHDDLSFWEKDKSLAPLKDRLHRRPGVLKAVSFDFFDTLVCRLTPEPENLFIEASPNRKQKRIQAARFKSVRKSFPALLDVSGQGQVKL
jgi:hypothetical protein